MTSLERAIAALEASTEADLDKLCGADRLTLYMLLHRWGRMLDATAPRRRDDERFSVRSVTKNEPPTTSDPIEPETPAPAPRIGILALLNGGERSP